MKPKGALLGNVTKIMLRAIVITTLAAYASKAVEQASVLAFISIVGAQGLAFVKGVGWGYKQGTKGVTKK